MGFRSRINKSKFTGLSTKELLRVIKPLDGGSWNDDTTAYFNKMAKILANGNGNQMIVPMAGVVLKIEDGLWTIVK